MSGFCFFFFFLPCLGEMGADRKECNVKEITLNPSRENTVKWHKMAQVYANVGITAEYRIGSSLFKMDRL